MADSTETDALRQDIEQLRQDLAALTDSVKQRTGTQTQAGLESARERACELGSQIEARPLTSVVAAFGAGLLLGKLFSR